MYETHLYAIPPACILLQGNARVQHTYYFLEVVHSPSKLQATYCSNKANSLQLVLNPRFLRPQHTQLHLLEKTRKKLMCSDVQKNWIPVGNMDIYINEILSFMGFNKEAS